MSVYIQEVLGLLKRNKKKKKLDKMRDHFEFGKLYHTSNLNTGAAYNPKMEPFVVKWGDLVCEATENLTRTKPGEGKLGFVPVYTTPEGSCAWDTLMDSIITQNAIGDTINIAGDLYVEGTITTPTLTEDRIVIVGPGGVLEDDPNFTMDGVTFTALVNAQHGSLTMATVPPTTTTLNSNIVLNGPITDSQGNVGQLSQVLVGLGDGRVIWSDDDVVEALTYGSLWQGNVNNLKQELPIGTADQILISDGVTFSWEDNPAAIVGEQCDIYRIPLWTPNSNTLGCSLLIQDGDSGTPATKITNDGQLVQTKELFLDTVAQDDTLTEVLVRDTGSSNEVKFRDVSTIVPAVGFDTLPMSQTADWDQVSGYRNAFINLEETASASYRIIKGMTPLEDGMTGVVIAENAQTGSLLPDGAIRFGNWANGLANVTNRVSWYEPTIPQLGYKTSELLYGESIKIKYHYYDVDAANSVLYWESCCKLYSENTCPVTAGATYIIDEDTSLTNTMVVIDDGYGGYGNLFQLVGPGPSNGVFSYDTGTGSFLFTPDANWYGTTSFQFQVFDGYCTSNISTINIVVNSVVEPPLWTSTDPVTANTYPNLTGNDVWTYNWTTTDPDHPCTDLTYTITVDGVEIFPAAGSSWLSFVNNNDCTGTLSGTYPAAGGNYVVQMIVEDPDGLVDTQTFTIGGLAVTKDTYFVTWHDTSGSMNSTIFQTSQISSVPVFYTQSTGQFTGTDQLRLSNGVNTGLVSNPNGLTSKSYLLIRAGMSVTGNGIPPNTIVGTANIGNPDIFLVDATTGIQTLQNTNNGDIITFSLTDAMVLADYQDPNNLRNLLQDFYAVGQTLAQEIAGGVTPNPATNGQDMYDSHLYWGHSPAERQIDMMNNRGQGTTIGTGGYFPDADNLMFLCFADESDNYGLNGVGNGRWADRQNSMVANLNTDVNSVVNFINTVEAAAGNNSIYRSTFFQVNGATPDLAPLVADGGNAGTDGGGLLPFGINGTEFTPPAATFAGYSSAQFQQMTAWSTGAPIRLRWRSDLNNVPATPGAYWYNQIRTALINHGYTGI